MSGPTNECPDCGHAGHDPVFMGQCTVIWMGERCDCGEVICAHEEVVPDDDGLDGKWFYCESCQQEVALSDPDENGNRIWEIVT
jgi:hypothetical protein